MSKRSAAVIYAICMSFTGATHLEGWEVKTLKNCLTPSLPGGSSNEVALAYGVDPPLV